MQTTYCTTLCFMTYFDRITHKLTSSRSDVMNVVIDGIVNAWLRNYNTAVQSAGRGRSHRPVSLTKDSDASCSHGSHYDQTTTPVYVTTSSGRPVAWGPLTRFPGSFQSLSSGIAAGQRRKGRPAGPEVASYRQTRHSSARRWSQLSVTACTGLFKLAKTRGNGTYAYAEWRSRGVSTDDDDDDDDVVTANKVEALGKAMKANKGKSNQIKSQFICFGSLYS